MPRADSKDGWIDVHAINKSHHRREHGNYLGKDGEEFNRLECFVQHQLDCKKGRKTNVCSVWLSEGWKDIELINLHIKKLA
jgi:hypothetical protein